MKTKILSLLFVIVANIEVIFAANYSGTCGENLLWSLNTGDSVLNIYGSGAMTDYSSASDVPWYSYRSKIKSVNFPADLTSIGNYAFRDCSNLSSIIFNDNLERIGSYSFYGCNNKALTSITIPNNVTTIGDRAFYGGYINSVTIYRTLPPSIGERAFPNGSMMIDKSSGISEIVYITATIYVPCEYVPAYLSQWTSYSSQITNIPFPYTVGILSKCQGQLISTLNNAPVACDNGFVLAAPTHVGYHFIQWSDGNTENPRHINVNSDAILTAEYEINYYSLSVSFDASQGSVSPSNGSYAHLSDVEITATPNEGYYFERWSDANTNNPRTITMTKDVSISAIFVEKERPLKSLSVNGELVTVSDSMFFYDEHGDSYIPQIEVSASSATATASVTQLNKVSYGWNAIISVSESNGQLKKYVLFIYNHMSKQKVRISLTGEDRTSYSLTADSEAFGSVVGSTKHQYSKADQYSTFLDYTGYKLGERPSHVGMLFTSNALQEGDIISVLVTRESNIGDGELFFYSDEGTTSLKTIKGVYSPGLYSFELGSNARQLRSIYLYRNDMEMNPHVAYLEVTRVRSTYDYSINCDENEGNITTTNIKNAVIAYAIPNDGYHFTHWNDGNTDNPRTIELTQDTSFTAVFAINQYLVQFVDWDGTILKSDSIAYGSAATPPEDPTRDGYNFLGWDMDDYNNVGADLIVTALYESNICLIASGNCGDNLTWELSCDSVLTISGDGAMTNYNFVSPHAPWYSYNSAIKSIIINDGVTSIGQFAFYNCEAISVSMPSSVTEIATQAFRECHELTDVQIPENVTTIGYSAFMGCVSLTSIFIPHSITNIGGSAFGECYGMISINVARENANYSSIDGVLYDKDTTTLIQYPYAKQGACVIPSSVTSIGYCAICGNGITSITCEALIPPVLEKGAITSVNKSIFLYVPIQSIELYKTTSEWKNFDRIVPIGGTPDYRICVILVDSASYYTIDSAIINLQQDTALFYFSNNQYVVYAHMREHNKWTLTRCSTPNYNVYGWVDVKTRTWIAVDTLDMNLTKDTTVFLLAKPRSYMLRTYANNGQYGWACCDTIARYGEKVQIIAHANSGYLFKRWNDGNTDIQREVILIQDTSFTAEFEKDICIITSGICGESLTWLLTCDSILIVSGNGSIPNYTASPWYNNSREIKHIIISDGVTGIGNYAFKGLENVVSISLANSVLTIGEKSFENCKRMSSVEIPQNVTSIGYRSFGSCNALTSVVWNAKNCTNSSTDTPFPNSNYINSFVFGNEVENIPAYVCKGMSNITSINIPSGVTTIGDYAFSGCSKLTTITIPNNVSRIGSNAFKSTSISTFIMEAETPPTLGTDALPWMAQISSSTGNVYYNGTIYIPCGAADAYRFANNWSKYKDNITYKPLPYTVTVNPSTFGTVIYPMTICDTVLTASPYYGYHFVQWNDSNTNNPRIVEITSDTTFAAEFAQNPRITYVFDKVKGTVDGDTILAYNAEGEITFTAAPNYGYHFTQWADGVTENPRTAHIDQDTVFEVIFAPNMYVLSINSEDDTKGTVSNSSGVYEYSSEVQISATPALGYGFMQWSDKDTQNPRNIHITKDISLTASFLENTNVQSITVNGKSVSIADTMTCFISDTIINPEIEVIPYFESTQVIIAPLSPLRYGWQTTITLTAIDGTTKDYMLTIVKGSNTNVRVTITARNVGTKSGEGDLYNDATVSVKCGPEIITDEYGITGYKLKTGGNYVAITLNNESFATGDVLNIYTTNISNSANDVMDGYLHLYTDAGITPLTTIKEHDEPGLHTAVLGSGVNGQKAIYLYRTGNDMNPYVAYMEIVRNNDPRSDSALLIDATIGHKSIEWNGTVGTLYVLPSDDVSSLPVTFALPEYATADVASGIRHNFTTPLYITVTAERGNSVTYTLQTQTRKCGDNLYWILKRDSTLIIEGTGAMYDYANITAPWNRSNIKAIEFPKEMTTIGAEAFSGCQLIQSVVFGTEVKTIGEQAFYNCTGLKDIYNYRATPSVAYSNTFDGIDKFECVLHVLSESVNKYRYATGWRDFYYIQTIDANEILEPVDNVIITPGSTTAGIVWPVVTGAASYELVIRDMSGNVICTLTFNASGQLIGIAFAPNRNRKAQQTQVAGFQFTVSGLDSNTTYSYELTALNENGDSIETLTGTFTTTSEIATGIDTVLEEKSEVPQKILRNGQILIIRGEKTFTLQGQKVK